MTGNVSFNRVNTDDIKNVIAKLDVKQHSIKIY